MFRRRGLPENWSDVVHRTVAVWATLDEDERAVVAADMDWLLRHKHWEAADGFDITDAMRVTIASQAALLVLGLDVDELREVSAVIVYPTAMVSRGLRAGPIPGTVTDAEVPILGEAHDGRGPVLLAWDECLAAASTLGNGRNVIVHEFAHKLDFLDHVGDGTPPLEGRVARDQWIRVCTDAYEALGAGEHRPPLDPYGATNPAEFFAVATEAFFDVPTELDQHEPDLYSLLRDYFAQDPAARAAPRR